MSANRLTYAAILLIVTLIVAGCSELDQQAELAPLEIRNSVPSQEFFDVEMVHTNRGRISIKLRAPVVHNYEALNRAELKGGVEVDFYRNGVASSFLTADSGEVQGNGSELHAFGNVVVRTDSGMVIMTPAMRWTQRDHLIRSDTIVTIYTQWDTLYGEGLVASDDLRYRRLIHPYGVSHRNLSENDTSAVEEETMQEQDSSSSQAVANPF